MSDGLRGEGINFEFVLLNIEMHRLIREGSKRLRVGGKYRVVRLNKNIELKNIKSRHRLMSETSANSHSNGGMISHQLEGEHKLGPRLSPDQPSIESIKKELDELKLRYAKLFDKVAEIENDPNIVKFDTEEYEMLRSAAVVIYSVMIFIGIVSIGLFLAPIVFMLLDR